MGRKGLQRIARGQLKPISVEVYTNLMSNRFRVAIMLATALMLGAEAYGHAFEISPPGALQGIWNHSNLVTYGLAVLGVFLIYRWWALLPAIAPTAVMVYLHTMTDYVEPWHGDAFGSFDFSDQPVLYVFLALVGTALQAAFLSVGLLLRAAWERVHPRRRESSLPDSA